MNKETEIKLRVSETLAALRAPLLKKRNKVVGSNANCSISTTTRLRDWLKQDRLAHPPRWRGLYRA
jgi:hypothetical protein